MFLEFPEDPVCKNNSAEAQFMLGPDWLVAPVTSSGNATWPVYLPSPGAGFEWLYWWNNVSYAGSGGGGQWHTMNTTSIAEFPLFYRSAIASRGRA